MTKKSTRFCSGKDHMYDYQVKLIIIGDSGVGKTNILTRFCEDIFKQSHVATIGVDFSVRTIQIEDKKLKLQVWDTAGQQRFKTITQTYYKGATGIILVYAVNSRQSFLSVEKWINQVMQRTPSSVKKLLVANKVDVSEADREISKEEGELIAGKYGLDYLETSAKSSQNIEEIFFSLGRSIKTQLQAEIKNQYDGLSRTVTLSKVSHRNSETSKNRSKNQGCNC